MPDLKLPKLPDRTPVKLTITIPPDLSRALHEYAAAYRQAYGEEATVCDLIPAMLARFVQSDREFARRCKG